MSQDDVVWYYAERNDDTHANGGACSYRKLHHGKNIWPDVTQEQRKTDIVHYRKMFIEVNRELTNIQLKLTLGTYTTDCITFFPATMTDTQADIRGDERAYGVGRLKSVADSEDVACLDLFIVAADPEQVMFQAGDLLHFQDSFIFTRIIEMNYPSRATVLFQPILKDLPSGTFVSSIMECPEKSKLIPIWEKRTIKPNSQSIRTQASIIHLYGEVID